MGREKAVINEIRHPYIVQLAVDSEGLDLELNRRILGFHNSRRIKPRYGRSFTEAGRTYGRWCFSHLKTARGFAEQFGGQIAARHSVKLERE